MKKGKGRCIFCYCVSNVLVSQEWEYVDVEGTIQVSYG